MVDDRGKLRSIIDGKDQPGEYKVDDKDEPKGYV